MQTLYDNKFYDLIDEGSRLSAKTIITFLQKHLKISSVLDVGCARGVWLSEWGAAGVSDIIGIDGNYVDKNTLYIQEKNFIAHDLMKNFNLNRMFDLVMSLEVAEHLPENRANNFIDSLTAHSDIIVFSSAVPGQGGVGHFNEQPHEYWRKKFKDKNFIAIDVRNHFIKNQNLEPWYKYNLFLYVKEININKLDNELKQHLVGTEQELKIIWPYRWKIISAVYKFIPEIIKKSRLIRNIRKYLFKVLNT